MASTLIALLVGAAVAFIAWFGVCSRLGWWGWKAYQLLTMLALLATLLCWATAMDYDSRFVAAPPSLHHCLCFYIAFALCAWHLERRFSANN